MLIVMREWIDRLPFDSLKKRINYLARVLVHPRKASSADYVSFLRSEGVEVGENVVFFGPIQSHVDVTRPSLITIGNNVKITRGVTILTHDYGWNVLRLKYGEVLGSAGRVIINDNVFVGNNVTILKGTEIGSNTIIGANSLVNSDIPSDTVAVGIPAKPVMSMNEYYEQRKERYLDEAREYAQSIVERYDRRPEVSDFVEFFPLFLERDESEIRPEFRQRLTDSGRLPDEHVSEFLETEPQFDSFEEFLDYCDV